MKGLKRVWKPDGTTVILVSAATFAISYAVVRPIVRRAAVGLENRRKAVSGLFTLPLIFSAALLSFAHGANDVANAVGPLAAIVAAAETGSVAAKASIPLWVMMVGAFGISAGLVLFGPKLIRTVGEKITRLDQARAFCVALSAAVTVIAASRLGLPVSSTHIAVGGVFGVGFVREFIAHRDRKRLAAAEAMPVDPSPAPPELALVGAGAQAAAVEPPRMPSPMPSVEEKVLLKLEKAERRRLVRRSHLMTIVAAWIVTVPCAAALAAALYLILVAVLT